MSPELIHSFKTLWTKFRGTWCDRHDLNGALAFSHPEVKIPFFHRVVNVDVEESDIDRLVNNAIQYFKEKQFECAFTVSPFDRPSRLGAYLIDRGFQSSFSSVMLFEKDARASHPISVASIRQSDESELETWSDVMTTSFELPRKMATVGRTALLAEEVLRFSAVIDDTVVGTTLLYSSDGLGYIDFVGTLPEFRRQGVAAALVTEAVAASQQLGNQWVVLETSSDSAAERLYEKLGFNTIFKRCRLTLPYS